MQVFSRGHEGQNRMAQDVLTNRHLCDREQKHTASFRCRCRDELLGSLQVIFPIGLPDEGTSAFFSKSFGEKEKDVIELLGYQILRV